MKDAAELCRGLLRKAKSDRMAMQASLEAKAFDAACFHAQQLTEKCLKAFLAYRQVGFPYTHNLTKLIEIGAGIDSTFRSLLPTVTPLTPYAVELRYDDSFWPTRQVAEEARASAVAACQFVLDRLPPERREIHGITPALVSRAGSLDKVLRGGEINSALLDQPGARLVSESVAHHAYHLLLGKGLLLRQGRKGKDERRRQDEKGQRFGESHGHLAQVSWTGKNRWSVYTED